MPLTDAACKNASCPSEKARARFTDAGGLYLEVAPGGSKRWFWKYLFNSKEKRLALGSYPDTSLKAAREARDDARKLQRAGTDPAHQRQLDKLQNKLQADETFEAVARELFEIKRPGWSDSYAARWIERMEKDLFPFLGSLPLTKIPAPLLQPGDASNPSQPGQRVARGREHPDCFRKRRDRQHHRAVAAPSRRQ